MNGMKFRVWLENSKEMVYPKKDGASVVMKPNGSIWKFDYSPNKNQYDLFPIGEPHTILFSTMYQDRNGKEIFEGDFVQDVVSGDYYLIQFDATKGFYGVQWPDFTDERGINYLEQRVVVVGNIKENYEFFLYLSIKRATQNGNK
jgi:hypothetical protein